MEVWEYLLATLLILFHIFAVVVFLLIILVKFFKDAILAFFYFISKFSISFLYAKRFSWFGSDLNFNNFLIIWLRRLCKVGFHQGTGIRSTFALPLDWGICRLAAVRILSVIFPASLLFWIDKGLLDKSLSNLRE